MDSDLISAPDQANGRRGVPQAVDAPLSRAAVFLVATINPGPDNRNMIRSFCGDLAALIRAVEFRDIEAALSCVAGFGSEAMGSAVSRSAPGEPASLPRNPLRAAPCRRHARRFAVPHSL